VQVDNIAQPPRPRTATVTSINEQPRTVRYPGTLARRTSNDRLALFSLIRHGFHRHRNEPKLLF
jgi:hypothetical protein